MNELLFVGSMVLYFFLISLAYRFWGKAGLYAWIVFAVIMANLEALICVDLFGISTTLGNVMYGTLCLATDILNENYGPKAARRGVMIGFGMMAAMTISSLLNIRFQPNGDDLAHGSFAVLFEFMPRMAVSSYLTFLVSNFVDIRVFSFLRKVFPSDRAFWIRNNGSTLVSQLVDTILFSAMAYTGIMSIQTVVEIAISMYIFKFIVSWWDTPFLWYAKRIKASGKVREA